MQPKCMQYQYTNFIDIEFPCNNFRCEKIKWVKKSMDNERKN